MREAAPGGFTFTQFLVDGDDPLLFHTGPRRMFPLVSHAIARAMPLARIRRITFGHLSHWSMGAKRSRTAIREGRRAGVLS